ncbi:MAG: DUF2218 domain-containing protein [Marinobacter sp.]
MPVINATVAIADPGRLIRRLCKHFSHGIEASWTDTAGHLMFSIGECRLAARQGILSLTCESPGDAELAQLADVVASHLERFAGGEVTEVQWQAA